VDIDREIDMGRTVPSFRIALAMEQKEWKTFRNALDKSERKEFDDMWDLPKLYTSACSNSVQLVPLHPIIMSILFHHYKDLQECISEVERLESKVNRSTKRRGLTEKEEKQEEEVPVTLDSFLSSERAAAMERCTT
jgi:hypothetical protein